MKLLTSLVIVLTFCFAEGYDILAIFPYQGRSHNIMFEPLMKGLALAGHNVDVVSHFVPKNPPAGFNHISLEGTLHFYVNNMTVSKASKMNKVSGCMSFISAEEPHDLCNLMRLPQLQEILQTKKKYDVMVTEVFGTNCFLAVAHKLKLPVIGVVSSVSYPWAYGPLHLDDNPSYIPTQLSRFSSNMNFLERLENLAIHVLSKSLFFYYDKTVSEPLARQYVEDLPPLNDIYYNMSLMLVNAHHSIHGVRPTNPAVIEIAGVHIDKEQKLSEELEVYLNASTRGVVYFSMGSMVKSESFSVEKIKAIYASFSALSNYNVLWKGKIEEMPVGLPSNVKMVSWAPQYAILRHPNVKAFVTHGGLMGTLESVNAGVPMIGIPIFADQMSNIAGYVLRGIAIKVDYQTLDKATFSHALDQILNNPEYRRNIDRVSRLFNDRPLSPIDEAVYWVEFIIRNGGDSLKSSGLHLNWFQYNMIDIALFLLAVTAVLLTVVFFAVRKLIAVSTSNRSQSSGKKLKTK